MSLFLDAILSCCLGIVVGLLGSPHCLIMCGGCSLLSTNTFKDSVKFQLGRLLGYSIVFGAANLIFKDQLSVLFERQSFYVVLAVTTVLLLVSLLNHHQLSRFIPTGVRQISFINGLLMALIPCGWLWAVIIVIPLVTRSEYTFLFGFWFGSISAFAAADFLKKNISNKFWLKILSSKKTILAVTLVSVLIPKIFGATHLHVSTLKSYITPFAIRDIPISNSTCTGSQSETIPK